MSNYDPFRLYSRSQAKSYKGQVLRKKYYPYHNLTLSDDDYKRVIDTLISQGYLVFPPGHPLPSKPELFFQNMVYTLDTEALDLTARGDYLGIPFSMLWDAIYLNFADILTNVPLDKVSDFQILINLLSINYYGTFTCSSSPNGNQFQFYFEDPASVLLVPDNLLNLRTSNVNLISLQSYSNSQYLESYGLVYSPGSGESVIARSTLTDKLEGINSPYLYSYSNTEKSIIPFLAAQDYTSIDFPLYHIALGGPSGSVNINSSFLTVQVYLQYKL